MVVNETFRCFRDCMNQTTRENCGSKLLWEKIARFYFIWIILLCSERWQISKWGNHTESLIDSNLNRKPAQFKWKLRTLTETPGISGFTQTPGVYSEYFRSSLAGVCPEYSWSSTGILLKVCPEYSRSCIPGISGVCSESPEFPGVYTEYSWPLGIALEKCKSSRKITRN